ncbi:MAG: hypothetical protein A3C88_00715 [Candidatus Yanofskybacteria bacterium RIFCSPHIGHO2_02_FULL_50_12]|uniref:Uncharacterized protein n=1 Tax=Candidatus Yanofskybacteria bacterium RIFCSPHIGHO2_02_FULL_50_12 TaxID=1802685 RepID=A0A1F8FVG8_9BACT|nr:MAG: hypothetical protein A3C88_00715 [Candidatus Yanofskybacteria bacterium RIFCSPHIGHO2_02_FULL_50_12]
MKFQRFIATILVSTILMTGWSALVPLRTASAAVDIGDRSVRFSGCFTAGILSPAAKALIDKGLQELQKKVSALAKDFVKGVLSGFLGGLLGSTIPTDDKAGESIVAYMTNRDYQEAVISRCAAWSIMDNLSSNTLNLVRTGGRDGGVTFVENWRNFQTQSQYRGENIFRAMLSTTQLCDYFGNDVRQTFGLSPGQRIELPGQNTRVGSLQPFNTRAGCTLPPDFDMAEYQRDFAGNGGWDTWARIIEPQNNPYGVLFTSLDEISKQRTIEEQADNNQVLANSGYTGVSECLVSFGGQCIAYKNIKTPGSYIAQNVAATVGAQFNWLTSTEGVNTIIADATEVMLQRLFDLSNPNEGNYYGIDPGRIGATPRPGTTATPIPTPAPNPAFNICSAQSITFMNDVKGDLQNREIIDGIFGDGTFTEDYADNLIAEFELRREATSNAGHQAQITVMQSSLEALKSVATVVPIPQQLWDTVSILNTQTIGDIDVMIEECLNPSDGGGGDTDGNDGGGFETF